MKKLFFFKSSASSNGNKKASLPPSTDKQVYWESPSEHGLKGQAFEVAENSLHKSPEGFSKTQKQIHGIQNSNRRPLRQSLSMSSASLSGLENYLVQDIRAGLLLVVHVVCPGSSVIIHFVVGLLFLRGISLNVLKYQLFSLRDLIMLLILGCNLNPQEALIVPQVLSLVIFWIVS